MLDSVADYLGFGTKPVGLPTRKGVALERAHADYEWPNYFGEGYFHQYWQGNKNCYSGCGVCGWVGGSIVLVIIIGLFASIGYANSGIGNLWYGIWLIIGALFPIVVMGFPILNTRLTRYKIYHKYLNQLSIDRNWEQVVLPIARNMICNKYDRQIADYEAGLKPLRSALDRAEAQKKYALAPENPLTDRGATLEKVDKIIIERKAQIAHVLALIGDARVNKELALGKADEVEYKTLNMSRDDDLSKADALGVINSLAADAGLTPVAMPSEEVDQALLVNSLMRDEIRKSETPLPKTVAQGVDKA